MIFLSFFYSNLAIVNQRFVNHPVLPVAFLSHTDFTGAIIWFAIYAKL